MSLALWLLKKGRLRVWCEGGGQHVLVDAPWIICPSCQQRVLAVDGLTAKHSVKVPRLKGDAES